MNDAADQAAIIAERDLEVAFYEHHARQKDVDQIVINGLVICTDCNNTIPPERVEAKPDCVRCLICQEIHEKEQKLWR